MERQRSIRTRRPTFAPVSEVLEALKDGQMVIVVDDEDRESTQDEPE